MTLDDWVKWFAFKCITESVSVAAMADSFRNSITSKSSIDDNWRAVCPQDTQLTTQLHKTTANHSLHTQAEHRMQ